MTPAIVLADAGKRYRKYIDNPTLIGSALQWRTRTKRDQLWAVRHVDLEVPDGACYGIIGRNGSGKSTTLQMLAGVTAPTEGRVRVRGTVAPLISVGVGFHPELTGRENTYVNATILGLSRQEIDDALDGIIEFSEIEEFIDTPVKFYSSGMLVRLGFSVAIQARPDVLLLDEILAVGDIAFQMKCFDRMKSILSSGMTVVLVSHNLTAVRQLCSQTLVLHAGDPRFFGPTSEAISRYQRILADQTPEHRETREWTGMAQPLPNVARIVDVQVQPTDQGIAATVIVDVEQPWPSSSLAFGVTTRAGVTVYYEPSPDFGAIEPGRWTYTVTLSTPLPSNDYDVTVAMRSLDPLGRLDLAAPVPVTVTGRGAVTGVADLGARLSLRVAGP